MQAVVAAYLASDRNTVLYGVTRWQFEGQEIFKRAVHGMGMACESALAKMGARASDVDLVVQLSPCIRPPHYEVDFAAETARQCREAGVEEISDCGICTACNLTRYYSYRAENGRTGRMLALLALKPSHDS